MVWRPDSEITNSRSPVVAGVRSRVAVASPETRSNALDSGAGITVTPVVPGTFSRFIGTSPPAR